MKTLHELLELVASDPVITRFKKLETVVDQDEELKGEYAALLNLQKRMVQYEATKHQNASEAKEAYESAKSKLLEHVLMSEYLDLLEEINENLDMIQSIIETEIAKDFL